ncbi:hypothetical protein PR048_032555 [Dryococelus australis]|uniref:Uncharacterized protein n=1 Tax=Dryococelus australis TaxID=614101 RepID=A0ABQ9G2I2_9NEOP|nr:hypothetical protein PR048_032555 [Dryococelus australis]
MFQPIRKVGCLHSASPPTKANRLQSPAGSPDFRRWESCWMMPLVGGFSRGSPVSPAPSFRRRSVFTSITLIGFRDLAVKSLPNLFTHSLNMSPKTCLLKRKARSRNSCSVSGARVEKTLHHTNLSATQATENVSTVERIRARVITLAAQCWSPRPDIGLPIRLLSQESRQLLEVGHLHDHHHVHLLIYGDVGVLEHVAQVASPVHLRTEKYQRIHRLKMKSPRMGRDWTGLDGSRAELTLTLAPGSSMSVSWLSCGIVISWKRFLGSRLASAVVIICSNNTPLFKHWNGSGFHWTIVFPGTPVTVLDQQRATNEKLVQSTTYQVKRQDVSSLLQKPIDKWNRHEYV